MENYFQSQQNVLLVFPSSASEQEVVQSKSGLQSIGLVVKTAALEAISSGKTSLFMFFN
jgi:hypothetical protein